MPCCPPSRHEASFVNSEYFEPQFYSNGLSTTVLMTTFPSFMAFWYRTIKQHLLINCYTFVPHIDKYLKDQGQGLLAAHRGCMSFIRYFYHNKEHTWHTVSCRYMTTLCLQTRRSPRKSLNRLDLFVIKDAYFWWQSPAFFLKCSSLILKSAYFVHKMFLNTIVWKKLKPCESLTHLKQLTSKTTQCSPLPFCLLPSHIFYNFLFLELYHWSLLHRRWKTIWEEWVSVIHGKDFHLLNY